ncbi:hypothetical protein NH340_JMT06157 [Sarcoptes scabiei]|uniref:Uncharacterized protein n=1 Tax=Sarcoptes scabiei TaxID=52283 RepID=A0A132ADL1_SARSC|nr:hypothetical protein QR98_0075420 [Sarcoptes scabiei]UXI20214.1 hypothetical protein NH340_JMT06157 [Sarcoptes scabiei]
MLWMKTFMMILNKGEILNESNQLYVLFSSLLILQRRFNSLMKEKELIKYQHDLSKNEEKLLLDKVGELEKEVQKYSTLSNKFEKIVEEKKCLENDNYVLIKQINDMESIIEKKQLQLQNSEEVVKVLEKEIKEIKEQWKSKRKSISFNYSYSNNSILDLNNMTLPEFGETVADIKIDSLEKDNQKLMEENSELKSNLNAIEKNCDQLSKLVETTKRQLEKNEIECQSVRNQNIDLRNHLDTLQQNIQRHQEEKKNFLQNLEDNQNMIDCLNARNDTLSCENRRLKIDLDNLQIILEKNDEKNKKLSDANESLRNQNETLSDEIKKLNKECRNFQDQSIVSSSNAAKISEQLEMIKKEIMVVKNEYDLMVDNKTKISEERDLLSIKIEKLQSANRNLVETNVRNQKKLMESKSKMQKIRINLQKKHEKILEFRKIMEVNAHEFKEIAKKIRFGVEFMSKFQSIVEIFFKSIQQSSLMKNPNVISMFNGQLQISIDSITNRLFKINSDLVNLSETIGQKNFLIHKLRQELEQSKKSNLILKKKCDLLNDHHRKFLDEIFLMKKSFEALRYDHEHYGARLNQEITKNCDLITAELKKQLDSISLLAHFKHTLEVRFEEAQKKLQDVNREKDFLKNSLANLKSKHDHEILKCSKYKSLCEDATKDVKRMQAIIDEINSKNSKSSAEVNCEASIIDAKSIKQEIELLKQEKKQLESRIHRLMKDLNLERQSFAMERRTKERLINENAQMEREIKEFKNLIQQMENSKTKNTALSFNGNATVDQKLKIELSQADSLCAFPEEDIRCKSSESTRAANESIISTASRGNCTLPLGTTFEMADEEGQFMDPNPIKSIETIKTALNETKESPFPDQRIKQLIARNSRLQPHLRSTYPVEFQHIELDENAVRSGNIIRSAVKSKKSTVDRIALSSSENIPNKIFKSQNGYRMIDS